MILFRIAALLLFIAGMMPISAMATGSEPSGRPQMKKFERAGVQFEELRDGVWMHTSYKDLPRLGPFPSNGLIVLQGKTDAVLIDSAWTDTQTITVLDWVRNKLGRTVIAAVFTHAHGDKMGGVGAVRARGIATFAHPVSNRLAPARGLVPAEHDLRIAPDGTAAGGKGKALAALRIFYPGPGHTEDNIVVAIRGTEILFGGCLIRPAESATLGNTADGDVTAWGGTVARVGDRFSDASVIIPSHGPPGGRDLLTLTERLARAAAARAEE